MTTFTEYQLEDGATILVKIPEDRERGGLVRAGKSDSEPVVVKAEAKFREAFGGVRQMACTIKEQLQDLRADEVEIKFGLVSTGKLGNFAVGEVGVEANYEVTLKWKNIRSDELITARAFRRFPNRSRAK